MELKNCSALVTGASAGIGREFARALGSDAHTLVLVARRKERLEELRGELIARNPNLSVHIRALDLSAPNSVDELWTSIEQEKIPIDLLINNAGLGDHGPFVSSDPVRVDEMLQVNIVALTRLTRRALPDMIARRRGAILNVSSSASFLPLPGMSVYAATKAYVTSFSEALNGELRESGVNVTAVCPGPVHTEFGEVASRPNDHQASGPEFIYVSAEEIAHAGLQAVARNRPILVPGWPMRLAMLLVRLTPMPILRLAWRFAR